MNRRKRYDFLDLSDLPRRRAARNRKRIRIAAVLISLIVLAASAILAAEYLGIGQVSYAAETPHPEFIRATVTAYTSSVDETDETPFITASGSHTRDGVIACPPRYAFGTKVEIDGKVFTCEDRMARRYADTSHFDKWVETKGEAYQWGSKELEIAIY